MQNTVRSVASSNPLLCHKLIVSSFSISTENALCSVFGDPHYRTFDGRLYNFQGTCKYILTSDCHDRTFTVRVRNDGRQTDNFAWTKTVFISISGHQVTLLQDYAVRADKKDVSLPHVIPNVLAVESDGFLIRVTTQIGKICLQEREKYTFYLGQIS